MIQYSETPVMESKSSGVLDTPLEPAIGLAEGETRWLAMTFSVLAVLKFESEPSSSAKADDPVFRNANDEIEKPRRTGYPACAGYDG